MSALLHLVPGSTPDPAAPGAPARPLEPELVELIRRMAEADVDRLWREAEEARRDEARIRRKS